MAIIKPFKGLRPVKDKVHLVASRSVDTYTYSELNDKLGGNPFTFLHIIKPKMGLEEKSQANAQLKKIKLTFNNFVKEGIFISDAESSLYVYCQEKNGHSYTGIIGCAAIDDYLNGVIKVHEQTLTNKEEKLRDYLEICDFNAEPVCLTYASDKNINTVIENITAEEPIYDFTTTDKARHKLWMVSDKKKIDIISEGFKNISSIYIADGHHRSASSALLAKKKREQNPDYSGSESFNYFLAIFFTEDQLKIYDFNRVVKDLNGLDKEVFLERVSQRFHVVDKGENIYKAERFHNMSMYLEGKWYSLELIEESGERRLEKQETRNKSKEKLDADILSEYILGPILNITDLKTNKRIGFVSGIKGMEELKNMVDSGKMKVAFGLFPVTMQQLKNIADAGGTMPPKSTWIEPKLRSGLVVYSL